MSLQAIDAFSLEQKGALAQAQLDVIANRFASTPSYPSLTKHQSLSAVDNLDVTSPIVLSFDTLINLGTGKIRIVDDGVVDIVVKKDTTDPKKGRYDSINAEKLLTLLSDAATQNSIKNDVEIELKDGVIINLKVGGVDRKESMAGSVYVKGMKLIIDPGSGSNEGIAPWRFDWDFGNKYHVELDKGVVYRNGGKTSQSNDAVGDKYALDFKTVIPDGEFLNLKNFIQFERLGLDELKKGDPSQKMGTATGELEESYRWHGYLQEDNFSNYSFDFANGKHALVTPFALTRDLDYTIQLNVKNFGVDAGKLTGDDLLYFDKNDFTFNKQVTRQNGNDNPVWSDWKRTSTIDDGIATVLKFSYDKLPAKAAAVTSDALFETLFKQDVIQYG
jgi:hypothetical protein